MKNKTNFLVEKYKIIENTDRRIVIRTPHNEYSWNIYEKITKKNLSSGEIQEGLSNTHHSEFVYKFIMHNIKREYGE